MFREMRRCKQQISEEECIRVLKEANRAVLAVNGDDGYPYSVPVNFIYDEKDKRIYLHGSVSGHKADSLKKDNKICFTTWDNGFKKEGHWEWNVNSVVIFGRAVQITDPDEINTRVRALAEKYYPDMAEADAEIAETPTERINLLAIEIEHMTGKLVNEK